MSPRRRLALAVAALAVAAAGCGVPVDQRARAIDDKDVPFGLLTPATTAPPR